MADTQPIAPTDDEIVALADATRTAEGGANGYILPISFTRAVLAKWGAQPVAHVPLTDAQIAEMMRDTWGCASIAPRRAPEFARAVERAHGITGGQHG